MSAATELTNDIINFIYCQGGFAFRASSTGIFDKKINIYRTAPKKGISDILACLPPTGKFIAIEVKIGKDRLSPEQAGFIENIRHAGGIAIVATDFDQFKALWEQMVQALKVER